MTKEAIAQAILDEQGFLVLTGGVQHQKGDLIPFFFTGAYSNLQECKARRIESAIVCTGVATRAEFEAQHARFAERFEMGPISAHADGKFYYKAVAE